MLSLARRVGGLLFGRYLLLTNTVSCSALLGVGDMSTQTLERWASGRATEPHDWQRTGRLASLGVVVGPLNHVWYRLLDRLLVGKSAGVIGRKILLDQLIASPVFAFTFFMGVGTLERQPIEESWGELKSKFLHVYMADWSFWPAAQAVNFYLLPTKYRVIYVATATCVWNSFLSFMKYRDAPPALEEPLQLEDNSNSPTNRKLKENVSSTKEQTPMNAPYKNKAMAAP